MRSDKLSTTNTLEARLETFDGHYVKTVLIPPFFDYPTVLVWGQRIFTIHDYTPTYREAKFAYHAVLEREDNDESSTPSIEQP